MAEFANDFNPEEHDDFSEFSPVPAGEYEAVITDSSIEDTSKGGKYLKVEFQIIAGQHDGRKVFENLNLVNENADAVRIAQSKLKSIAVAVGQVEPFKDSNVLHNKPLLIKVGVQKYTSNTGEEKMSNTVLNFKALGKIAQASSAQPQPQPQAQADNIPPFMRD